MGKITPPGPPVAPGHTPTILPTPVEGPDFAQPSVVEGDATNGQVGVRGTSDSGIGVVGTSASDAGVYGQSDKGPGVHGVGAPAGKFDGSVVVSGDITGGGLYSKGQAVVAGPMNIGAGLTVSGSLQSMGDINARANINVTGDVTFAGADCAEEIEAATAIDPGSVVVVDGAGRLTMCGEAYDKRVVGIVSGAGPLKPAIILGRRHGAEAKALLALSGRVYCKADARFAPIEIGDLLTTSRTPGHAMKADPSRSAGRAIGKALGSLGSGCGLIPVLVSLQ